MTTKVTSILKFCWIFIIDILHFFFPYLIVKELGENSGLLQSRARLDAC